MTIIVSGQGTAVYDNKGEPNYRAGAELGLKGVFNGFFMHGTAGIGNTASGNIKIGGEIPIYEYKYSNDGPSLGLCIYGEGKGAYYLTKNQNKESIKFGTHSFMADGGAGVQLIYRQNIFEGAIGFKGGYRYTGVNTNDPMLSKSLNKGKVYLTPTAEVLFHINDTGFSVGAFGDLHEAGAKLNYAF